MTGNYVSPQAAAFETRPYEVPFTGSGSTSNYALADTRRTELVVGTRIRVNRWSPALRDSRGVIVVVGEGERIGEGDCAVLLDEWDHPLGFFWNELELEVRA